MYKKISEIESQFKDLKIISYKTDGIWSMKIDPDYKIKKDDLLVFLGESKYIKDFYKQIWKIIGFKTYYLKNKFYL